MGKKVCYITNSFLNSGETKYKKVTGIYFTELIIPPHNTKLFTHTILCRGKLLLSNVVPAIFFNSTTHQDFSVYGCEVSPKIKCHYDLPKTKINLRSFKVISRR